MLVVLRCTVKISGAHTYINELINVSLHFFLVQIKLFHCHNSPRDNNGPTSEPGGVNDVVTVTSTSAVSTATVLKVPLNSSITTTATLVQSNGANPVGPRDAVSVDQKDGHLDVQVSTDSNRGNQLLVCDDHNDGQ